MGQVVKRVWPVLAVRQVEKETGANPVSEILRSRDYAALLSATICDSMTGVFSM